MPQQFLHHLELGANASQRSSMCAETCASRIAFRFPVLEQLVSDTCGELQVPVVVPSHKSDMATTHPSAAGQGQRPGLRAFHGKFLLHASSQELAAILIQHQSVRLAGAFSFEGDQNIVVLEEKLTFRLGEDFHFRPAGTPRSAQ